MYDYHEAQNALILALEVPFSKACMEKGGDRGFDLVQFFCSSVVEMEGEGSEREDLGNSQVNSLIKPLL